MNSFFTKDKIDQLIKEDVPYFDLTTHLMGIGDKPGHLRYITRNQTMVACSEEGAQVLKALGLEVMAICPSGTLLEPGKVILEARGNAAALHQAWRVVVNILEYNCGIATRTYNTLKKAREVNPFIHLLSTRKIFPGTKELAIKAVMSGGGYPHRLGLSESVLIFDHHLKFFENESAADQAIIRVKKEALEKKVLLEVGSMEDARRYMKLGIDGMQFDKFQPKILAEMVAEIRKESPNLYLIAAGGVTPDNAVEYAKTGVDALVTTAMYFGKPADIKAEMTPQ
ncbi:ModD protein [Desulfogranum japonicum]|uniref:ModD protein n=1 Tax=Desulfogranum japonicum TaxID=231447 RepID=UPI0004065A47|nr:ModD protein [Desulfogranum japonicum]